MQHIYEFSGCAPLLEVEDNPLQKWRRFYEENIVSGGQKYLVHHEQFMEYLDTGEYKYCVHTTKWPVLNHGEGNSNSAEIYEEIRNADPSRLTTDTNPTWEYVKLKPDL